MKLYIAAALLATGTAAMAQNLNQEVVIERDVQPVEREAMRPTWVSPTLLSTKVDGTRLSLNEYAGTAEITRSLPPLEAAAWADSVMRTPYKGYVALGYFPIYNAGVAAGYKFINTRNTTLAGHIAYNGATWKADQSGYDGHYNQHQVELGVDGRFGTKYGVLNAAVAYTYSSTGVPSLNFTTDRSSGILYRGTQGINIVDLTLNWKPSTWPAFIGHLGANVQYGGFFNDKEFILIPGPSYTLDPAKDVVFGVNTELGFNLGTGRLGIDVDAQFRHIDNYVHPTSGLHPTTGKDFEDYGSKMPGFVALTPAYNFATKNFSGRLGVRFDIETGGVDHDLRLAPDIDLQWAPSSMFAVSLTATGGDVLNSNAELWRRSPWMTGWFSNERSHVNADVNLGITFGSYRGFHATVRGGWTSAADWLHLVDVYGYDNEWMPSSTFDGFNGGIELGYSWRDKVVVTASADVAQHGKLYRWADNAKYVFAIAAKVHPIERLTIELGFDARVDRFAYKLQPDYTNNLAWFHDRISLGDTSNLHLGAWYDFNDAFTAFVQAENLLNHRWLLAPAVDSKGINGLFGIQYKF